MTARRRIGQGLHDEIVSSHRLDDPDCVGEQGKKEDVSDEELTEGVQEVQALLDASTEDLRHLSRGLDSSTLSRRSVLGAVRRIANTTDGCSLDVVKSLKSPSDFPRKRRNRSACAPTNIRRHRPRRSLFASDVTMRVSSLRSKTRGGLGSIESQGEDLSPSLDAASGEAHS